jgi:hypothetical protein
MFTLRIFLHQGGMGKMCCFGGSTSGLVADGIYREEVLDSRESVLSPRDKVRSLSPRVRPGALIRIRPRRRPRWGVDSVSPLELGLVSP